MNEAWYEYLINFIKILSGRVWEENSKVDKFTIMLIFIVIRET